MSQPDPAPACTPPAVDDPFDHRVVLGAEGLLAAFNVAGVLEAADVHVASRLALMGEETDPDVALAVALAVRAVRGGSVCVDLTTVRSELALDPDTAGLPWPDASSWVARVAGSALSRPGAGGVCVLRLLKDRLLYLDRYWREEAQVCDDLLARTVALGSAPGGAATAVLEAGLARVFATDEHDEQREAARIALRQRTTVLTGGPGTGKTTTVAGLLALLVEQAEGQGRPALRIALAAPTGKAAARLQQAVLESQIPDADKARLDGLLAVTLHRLLGSRPDSSVRFRHHRENRLPHDVIVVDETSMVSLSMMARLLEAVRPETRLILVGDPDQLTSVEAGAVLADLVEGLGARDDVAIATLTTSHRYGESIRELAQAVRVGDADLALELLRAGGDHLELVDDADPAPRLHEVLLPRALTLVRAGESGDVAVALAALEEQRLLCAHREGPHGVHHWNRVVERWIGEQTGEGIWSAWYPGRPLLVTANDYGLGVHNGDVGVAVRTHEGLRAYVATTGEPVPLATSRLGQAETMHAMTIHKSQGSQASDVVVVLPPPESRLLTRELFYTAITRARERVVVVGSEADIRAAIGRRAVRATGLRHRLAAAT
ncbi:MAG: exodeoxyribonuclease V subunit alpha [Nocardioides sp.]|nr:exodeoxyribonuclease V subunit alpha [Nocardioides sp.]